MNENISILLYWIILGELEGMKSERVYVCTNGIYGIAIARIQNQNTVVVNRYINWKDTPKCADKIGWERECIL